VFGCRYHGWSYNTEGKLIKAPEFEKVAGFNKGENGLWEISVNAMEAGTVWVCLETILEHGKQTPPTTDMRLKNLGLGRAKQVLEYRAIGQFNWKLACKMMLDSHNLPPFLTHEKLVIPFEA
jgi:phenylpropionate dioxygenase-like ring-hydroxylating dioxygenase large terminal subunit